MSDLPVNMTRSGPPATVLPLEDADIRHALVQAVQRVEHERRDAVAVVAARWPRSLDAWAALGACARDDVEAYMAYRIGYHRGLDALRANGWRGSGYVRWATPSNHGFLRCLLGLARQAERIGEFDEAERCRLFLGQLDPSGVPDTL